MSQNTNQFQSRLDAISKAEVVFIESWGCYQLQVESSDNRLTNGALTYTQYNNVFDEETSYSFVGVSDDGAIVNGYIHDGSSMIGRGYGGDPFELTMSDGSHKVISGPWSGRPSIHMCNSGIEYTEVRVGYSLIGFSKEFIQAIIDHFKLDACVKLISSDIPDHWHLGHIKEEIELQVTTTNKGEK
jgi:hypothetical protein